MKDVGVSNKTEQRCKGYSTMHEDQARGPEGETVLSLTMAEGGAINFLLAPELKAELATMLGRAETVIERANPKSLPEVLPY